MEKARVLVKPFTRASDIIITGGWSKFVELVPQGMFFLDGDKDIYCPGIDAYLPGLGFGAIFFIEWIGQAEVIIDCFQQSMESRLYPDWPSFWPTVLVVGKEIRPAVVDLKGRVGRRDIVVCDEPTRAWGFFCRLWARLVAERGIQNPLTAIKAAEKAIDSLKVSIQWESIVQERDDNRVFSFFAKIQQEVGVRNYLLYLGEKIERIISPISP